MNVAMDNAEVWKDIPNYEGKYQVSNYGRVWSITTERILKPMVNNHGYYTVHLSNIYNKRKKEGIHRLVALCFCEKPDECNVVNHKDGNKLNNYYTNLEWTTIQGNNKHAYETGLYNLEKAYESIEKASKACEKRVYIYEGDELLAICPSVRNAVALTGYCKHTILSHARSGKPLSGMRIEYATN